MVRAGGVDQAESTRVAISQPRRMRRTLLEPLAFELHRLRKRVPGTRLGASKPAIDRVGSTKESQTDEQLADRHRLHVDRPRVQNRRHGLNNAAGSGRRTMGSRRILLFGIARRADAASIMLRHALLVLVWLPSIPLAVQSFTVNAPAFCDAIIAFA